MARQVGPVFATGTIDGIIFYKLGDTYYMRSKGDYKSAKMMRKDPRLKRTMQKADQFGRASNLVKEVYYRHLPKAVRKYGLFGKLTGMANSWLQQGKSKAEAKELLLAHCQTLIHPPAETEATPLAKKIEATPVVKAITPNVPLQSTVAAKSTKTKPAVVKQAPRVKQARYLSHWKVKRNGRLYMPSPRPAVPLATVVPLVSKPTLISGSDLTYNTLFQEKNE